MSHDPLSMLLFYGAQFTGFVSYLLGFAVFVLIWRIQRDLGYFLLSLGFGVFLVSQAVLLLLMLRGGGRVSRSGEFGYLYVHFAPYLNLIAAVLLIAGFVILGRRAFKTFKAPTQPASPPVSEYD